MARRHWLLKTEPSQYSFDDLSREKRARWDGITNNLALKNLREARKGDDVLIYHSGSERAAVGTARIATDPYPDPKAKDPKLVVVDVEAGKKLPRPVELSTIKAHARLKKFPLVRLPRLSVVPVADEEWEDLMRLAGKK